MGELLKLVIRFNLKGLLVEPTINTTIQTFQVFFVGGIAFIADAGTLWLLSLKKSYQCPETRKTLGLGHISNLFLCLLRALWFREVFRDRFYVFEMKLKIEVWHTVWISGKIRMHRTCGILCSKNSLAKITNIEVMEGDDYS